MELNMTDSKKLSIFTSKVMLLMFGIPICIFLIALL